MISNYGDFGIDMGDSEFEEMENGSALFDALFEPFLEETEPLSPVESVNADAGGDGQRPHVEEWKGPNDTRQERFARLNDEELSTLLAESNSKSTEKTTKWGVRIFKSRCPLK